jgi:hypothetical protein
MFAGVCTFSGWIKAFPPRTEKAREVARCTLKETIPRFGIPVSIGSDNGPAFVTEVVQLMARKIKNSSGKIKHINKTLKITIKKTMPGDPPTMGSVTAHSLVQN